MNLPNTADIVIIGGGVMGASAAYNLSQRGMKNIVLLEKENFKPPSSAAGTPPKAGKI